MTNTISLFNASEFDEFIAYLNDQLADNGVHGQPYFMPFDQAHSRVSPNKSAAFRQALGIPYGKAGWRQLWLCRSEQGRLIGHVDLRAHADSSCAHRCILGMGVHRDYRQAGIGTQLISYVEQWANTTSTIKWIDLQVLSNNLPAVQLYLSRGFIRCGEIPALYQLDGQFFSETLMVKKLTN